MAGLTICLKRNPFHETPFDFHLVTIIAVEFAPGLVDRGNVRSEVPAMIETQNVVNTVSRHVRIRVANFVGIGCFSDIDLELGVISPKRRKRFGITFRGPA